MSDSAQPSVTGFSEHSKELSGSSEGRIFFWHISVAISFLKMTLLLGVRHEVRHGQDCTSVLWCSVVTGFTVDGPWSGTGIFFSWGGGGVNSA